MDATVKNVTLDVFLLVVLDGGTQIYMNCK